MSESAAIHMELPEEIKLILERKINTQAKIDLLNKHAFEKRNSDAKTSFKISEKALEIASAIHYLKGKADSLLNLGFYHMHVGEHENAFSQLFDCISIYSEINNEKGIADAQYNIGIVHMRLGGFSEAIEFLHKSLAFREKINDRSGMASCYFQLTSIHQHFNDLDGAFEAANKSLELQTELNDSKGKAAALMVLGEIYLKRDDLTNAKKVLEESLTLRNSSDEKMGYFATMSQWTELHMRLKEYDKAREFALSGLAMAKSEDFNFGTIRFMQIMGKLEFILNNLDKAEECYLEALQFAEIYSFKTISYGLHQSLASIYKLKGDFKSALEHHEKFTRKKEEILDFQTNTRMKSAQLLSKIEFAQKEAELEKTKNIELNEAYKIISEKNKEITDSINYAKRIQQGILPSEKDLKNILGDYFVFYKPKDIVSGDFFWCINTVTSDSKLKLSVIAAVDCTGHGVPGAFMSMLGRTLLNQTNKNSQINSPAQVLDFLNQELPKNLKSHQVETSIQDGMDIVLCAIDFNNLKLYYAGANNPCLVIRNNQLIPLKADKQPISASDEIEKTPFKNQTFDLQKNDCIYLYTDGYADQFGGPKGKKLKHKQLQALLLTNSSKPIEEQKNILSEYFENWKGDLEQVDDVTVIGIRI